MRTRTILLSAIVAIASGCQDPDIVSTNRDSLSWEEFLELVTPLPGGGYVANGDELFHDEAELVALYRALDRAGGLTVNQVGGHDDSWPLPQQRNLTYCVSTAFGPFYEETVAAVAAAAADWESAAYVDFIHDPSQDGNCSTDNGSVLFSIEPIDTWCSFLAVAFFPSDPPERRRIVVDWCAYPGIGPLAGLMRHELGHVLGFRHEHTRPESGVCFEDDSWRPLTDYDQASVMHYPHCNGTGDWELALTPSDREGARQLYGPVCYLSADASVYYVGQSAVWQIGSYPDGIDAYWYTFRDGVPQAVGAYAGATPVVQSDYAFQPGDLGSWDVHAELRDAAGTPRCTTNTVRVGVGEPVCGDFVCGPGEDVGNCADDCSYCGDGWCDTTRETPCGCESDCPPDQYLESYWCCAYNYCP